MLAVIPPNIKVRLMMKIVRPNLACRELSELMDQPARFSARPAAVQVRAIEKNPRMAWVILVHLQLVFQ